MARIDETLTPEYTGIIAKSGSISLCPDGAQASGGRPLEQIKTIR